MITPTLYLDLLLLGFCSNPSNLFYTLNIIFGRFANKGENGHQPFFSLLVPFIIFAITLLILRPEVYFLNISDWNYLVIALFLGLVPIAADIVIGIAYTYFKYGALPRSMSAPSSWQLSSKWTHLLWLCALIVAEKFIFRQFFFYVLYTTYDLGFLSTLLISSLAYALIHFHFGLIALPGKFIAGLCFGWIYFASGMALLPAVVAHLVLNLVVSYGIGRKH